MNFLNICKFQRGKFQRDKTHVFYLLIFKLCNYAIQRIKGSKDQPASEGGSQRINRRRRRPPKDQSTAEGGSRRINQPPKAAAKGSSSRRRRRAKGQAAAEGGGQRINRCRYGGQRIKSVGGTQRINQLL